MTPTASRPDMPDYGISSTAEGLLPWSWAAERLVASHDYWLATVFPDGRPHIMPVWGVWDGSDLWFSSGPRSRKARNLARDPRATATTDNPNEPVVLSGAAERVPAREADAAFTEAVNAKYETAYAVDFFLANATFRLRPDTAFGLVQEDFTGSPTRWTFPPRAG